MNRGNSSYNGNSASGYGGNDAVALGDGTATHPDHWWYLA
jgi:hypothetical protein